MNHLEDEQLALQRRDQILSAVGFVAGTFLQAADWMDSIDVVLERLGMAVGANRAYVFENHLSKTGVELTSQRAEWTANGIQPQINNEELQDIPWIASGMERWQTSMKKRTPIFGLIDDFPQSEQELLKSQQIQSLIAVPFFVRNQFSGFIGFDDCKSLRQWTPAEHDALLAATNALGAAIERQQLEHQLRFAQKMEAVGSLAAGVAHDFNNMLQAISAFIEIAKLKIGDHHPAKKELNEAKVATDRANSLTQKLLAFSRKQDSKPGNVDLNEVCQSVTAMARPIVGSLIELEENLASIAPIIHADSGLVSQVLLNLCLNARDAMPDGGRLTVSCETVPFENVPSEKLDGERNTQQADYARVSVTDTGSGIAPELQDRIFEPFFTTKEVGEGTGLGLSVAFGSVQECGGFINVTSEPGEGTQFDVYFPIHNKTGDNVTSPDVIAFGTETVLVVDDEPLVRTSNKLLLETLGYTVLEANDGANGLEVFKENASQIDVILTDTVMPRMDGYTFCESVLSIDKHARIIVLSGYSPDIGAFSKAARDNLILLKKPASRALLSKSIRCLLDQNAT